MKNSFLIKNADESFDHYYTAMKKRKNQQVTQVSNWDTGAKSTTTESKFGIVSGRKPTARDGHTMVIDDNGFLYIFGGDRHHMPFNDLYMICMS